MKRDMKRERKIKYYFKNQLASIYLSNQSIYREMRIHWMWLSFFTVDWSELNTRNANDFTTHLRWWRIDSEAKPLKLSYNWLLASVFKIWSNIQGVHKHRSCQWQITTVTIFRQRYFWTQTELQLFILKMLLCQHSRIFSLYICIYSHLNV